MIEPTMRLLADQCDALLVVGQRMASDPSTLDVLRRAYPDLAVRTCSSWLAALAEVHDRPVRAVLAEADPSIGRVTDALSALRSVAGTATRVVLCCPPEREPFAGELSAHGADDYVLLPLRTEEVDRAIDYVRGGGALEAAAEGAAASLAELSQLADAMATVGGKPMALIERLARLTHTAMASRGATVIVEGAVATSGDTVTKPALTAPLEVEGRTIGQLTVAERADRPYSVADADKLKHYAELASRMLSSASAMRRWRHQAFVDACSGLPNRRYLYDQLDAILKRAQREHFAVTLLLFDVDDFKSFNDVLGHRMGDEIIRRTGHLFQQHCREQDVVTRYGGDEFAVVFWDAEGPRSPGSKHPASALGVLDRVKQALATEAVPNAPKRGDGATSRTAGHPDFAGELTISGGLATYPWDASTRDELIEKADEALLAAKRAGKNRVYLIGDAGPR